MNSEKREKTIETKVKENGTEVIKKAQHDAERLLDKANSQAIETVTRSERDESVFAEALDREVQKLLADHAKTLTQMSDKTTIVYQEALQKVEKQSIQHLQQNGEAFLKQSKESLDDFKAVLGNETVRLQKEVSQKVADIYRIAVAEVAAYKRTQLDSVQNEVTSQIEQLTEEVLGQALDQTKQEELVLIAIKNLKLKKGQ